MRKTEENIELCDALQPLLKVFTFDTTENIVYGLMSLHRESCIKVESAEEQSKEIIIQLKKNPIIFISTGQEKVGLYSVGQNYELQNGYCGLYEGGK